MKNQVVLYVFCNDILAISLGNKLGIPSEYQGNVMMSWKKYEILSGGGKTPMTPRIQVFFQSHCKMQYHVKLGMLYL